MWIPLPYLWFLVCSISVCGFRHKSRPAGRPGEGGGVGLCQIKVALINGRVGSTQRKPYARRTAVEDHVVVSEGSRLMNSTLRLKAGATDGSVENFYEPDGCYHRSSTFWRYRFGSDDAPQPLTSSEGCSCSEP